MSTRVAMAHTRHAWQPDVPQAAWHAGAQDRADPLTHSPRHTAK